LAATKVTMTTEAPPAKVRLTDGLGPTLPERCDSDAPVCPWCDRRGWDTCQHADDARACQK